MNPSEALDRSIRLTRDLVADSASNETILETLQKFRVRCYGDARNLSSHSGQTALITFVTLVARMGIQVDLAIPNIASVGQQYPVLGGTLVDGLLDLGRDLVPGSYITAGDQIPCDITIAVGNSPVTSAADGSLPGWRLVGHEWYGELTRLDCTGSDWAHEWPLGAMISAALAATEVYKAAVRKLPLKDEIQVRLVEPAQKARVDFGVGAYLLSSRCRVGKLDIISAGAITQAFLYTLLRLPNIRGSIRVFERERADLTNLNRYMLMRRSHVGWLKTEILRAALPRNFSLLTVPERFHPSTVEQYLPMAPNVVVGVDHIASRWLAQQYTHGRVAIGATSHFFSQTSSHEDGQACGGCLHPRDEDDDGSPLPTISFVSFWAGLALASRLVCQSIGKPYGPERQDIEISTLRLDNPHGFLFRPVAARLNCPVGCLASKELRLK